MKYECGMIEDLLPLYKDGACSDSSKSVVEEHLEECADCKKMLAELQDESVDALMVREKETIIDSQSKFFKRNSAIIGSVIAAIFALPILICLVVNLVTGHGLSWFFIVLAAMLVPTSLFVVPLMVPENKMLLTMASFTFSVLFLLAVICIYSRGNWFFVAGSAVLFGLTVCFSPFIVCGKPLAPYLKQFKGLVAISACTLTFFLMMICIGLKVHTPGYFSMALGISAPCVAICWILFAIIRYLRVGAIAKTGICITVLSLGGLISDHAVLFFTMMNARDTAVQVSSQYSYIGAAIGIAAGVVLTVIGLLIGKKGEKNNENA